MKVENEQYIFITFCQGISTLQFVENLKNIRLSFFFFYISLSVLLFFLKCLHVCVLMRYLPVCVYKTHTYITI